MDSGLRLAVLCIVTACGVSMPVMATQRGHPPTHLCPGVYTPSDDTSDLLGSVPMAALGGEHTSASGVRWREFATTVHPSLPRFRFRLYYRPALPAAGGEPEVYLRRLEIFRGHARRPLQRLDLVRPTFESSLPVEFVFPPYVVDMNFDCYQDVRIVVGAGAHTANWLYWLYQPATGTFVRNRALEEIPNAVPVPLEKRVAGHLAEGNAGADHENWEYRWDGARLVLTRHEEQQVLDGDEYLHRVWVRRHGRLVRTVKRRDRSPWYE